MGIHIGQFHGKVFPELAARFPAYDIHGGSAGHLIEPGAQNGVGLKSAGTAGQICKDRLGDLLRQFGRPDLTQRRGINQVQMTMDQLRKGCFRTLPGILLEQFQIVGCHLQ